MSPRGVSKPDKRPCKKNWSKLAHLKRDPKKTGSSTGNISFFDTEPDKVIENAFRFMSVKPQHADWAAHIASTDIETLIHTSGSLSRVAANKFRLWFDELPDAAIEGILYFLGKNPLRGISKVPGKTAVSLVMTGRSLRQVSKALFASVLYNGCGPGYVGRSTFSVSLHSAGFRDLPQTLGPNVRTLHMGDPFPFSKRDLRYLNVNEYSGLRSFSYEPTRVAGKLYLRAALPRIIAAWGSCLEHLCLGKIDFRVVNAIARHCKKLRHLKLSCLHGYFSLEPMWKGLGTKLEHLIIQSEVALGSVAVNRPNISRLSVDLYGWRPGTEAMRSTLGATLLELKLGRRGNGNAELARICEACPNVVIHCFPHIEKCMPTATVLALGRSASSWRVSTRDSDFDESLFSRVGMSCVNLQRCSVTSFANAVPVHSFGDLFLSPKPKLKHIELHVTKISSVSIVL